MSDADTRATWTDRELLVYILTAMEHSGFKLDFNNAPIPVGRNPSGCAQRVTRLKKALKTDMDALRNGMPVSATKVRGSEGRGSEGRGSEGRGSEGRGSEGRSNKGKGKTKRKAGDDQEEGAKKRSRAGRIVQPEMEGKPEGAPETEDFGVEDGAEEEI